MEVKTAKIILPKLFVPKMIQKFVAIIHNF